MKNEMTPHQKLAEALRNVHKTMSRDYTTISTVGGFKIDSWKFFLAFASHDDEIREALAEYDAILGDAPTREDGGVGGELALSAPKDATTSPATTPDTELQEAIENLQGALDRQLVKGVHRADVVTVLQAAARCEDAEKQLRVNNEFVAAKEARFTDKTGCLMAENATLRAEITRLKSEREWRPIESAPKDNQKKLLCSMPMSRISIDNPPFLKKDQWTTMDGKFHAPTHWQPLPPPPKTGETP